MDELISGSRFALILNLLYRQTSAEVPLKRHFLQLDTGESGKMVVEGDRHSLNKENFIFWNVDLVAWGGQLNKKMTTYNYKLKQKEQEKHWKARKNMTNQQEKQKNGRRTKEQQKQ